MKKNNYTEPMMEIKMFGIEDIVTTSIVTNGVVDNLTNGTIKVNNSTLSGDDTVIGFTF